MNKFISLILLLLMMFLSANFCYAENSEEDYVHVQGSGTSGNDFLEMPELQKGNYVMAVLDGIYLAPIFGARNDIEYQKLEKCILDMERKQKIAIVDKFLKDNPEKWNLPMNGLIFQAFIESCQLFNNKNKK